MSSRGFPPQSSNRGGSHGRPPQHSRHGGGGQDNFVPPGPLTARANLFEITNLPNIPYFHYSVVFVQPIVKNRNRCTEIIDRLQNYTAPDLFSSPAIFDGRSSLYTARIPLKIRDGTQTFSVKMADSSSKEYKVQLSLANAVGIDMSKLQKVLSDSPYNPRNEGKALMPISIINLLVRAAPSLTAIGNGMDVHQVRAARLYVTDVGKAPLGGGLEMWQGYFQSARPSIGRMLLNIDTATATMIRPGWLPDVASEHLGTGNMRDLAHMNRGDRNYRQLESFLKKLFIIIDVNSGPGRQPAAGSRKKQIIGIKSRKELDSWTFLKDGQPMTVKIYYKQIYNKDLALTPFAIMTGNRESPTVFPAEFCWITPGQIYKKKLSASQTKNALSFTTKTPEARLQAICNGIGTGSMAALRAPTFEYQNSSVIRSSGMTVSTVPLEIRGKILRTPYVRFGNEEIIPRNGAWNMKTQQVRTPTQLLAGRWAVLDVAHKTNTEAGREFVRQLRGCLTGRGIPNSDPRILSGSPDGVEKLIKEARELKCLFMLVILPDIAEDIRNSVKYFGDVLYGVATQCVTQKNVHTKINDQYCNNLVLKINSRLLGINSVPETDDLKILRRDPFMIFGMDVAHPPPGVKNMPSIASVVSTMDPYMCQYEAECRVQEPGQEIIADLASMVDNLMKKFLEKMPNPPKPPSRFIFLRDGVSEGQFAEICQRELGVIESIIAQYRGLYQQHKMGKPEITFVIVRKRHHVRFFPIGNQGADKKGNIQAGFLAEEGVNNPFHPDFYLLSHGGLLGTSKPSYYTVLRDDCFTNKPSVLKDLAYALCHCYAAATRSVSIPAPIYYADKVCARAKFHYPPDTDIQSIISEEEFDLTYWQNLYRPLHPDIAKTMYFV